MSTSYNQRYTTVAVDRETAELLNQLIVRYKEANPFRQSPSKSGLIRLLVATAAAEGSGEVGPLASKDRPRIPGPGRRERF
jgi:hypothetical protein